MNLTEEISHVMYYLRPFGNGAILKNLYYTLIYSHFVYAIQVWSSAYDAQNKVLQKLILCSNILTLCLCHPSLEFCMWYSQKNSTTKTRDLDQDEEHFDFIESTDI